MHEELKQLTKDLTNTLKKVDVLKKEALSKLSEEQLKETEEISKDMTRATNAIKNGNPEVLTNLLNKYARSNRPK